MKLALGLLALLLVGCANTEVTAQVGPRFWNREDPEWALQLDISHRFGKHGICSYLHNSEIGHGPPFNDEFENTTDMFACGARWGK